MQDLRKPLRKPLCKPPQVSPADTLGMATMMAMMAMMTMMMLAVAEMSVLRSFLRWTLQLRAKCVEFCSTMIVPSRNKSAWSKFLCAPANVAEFNGVLEHVLRYVDILS